jgi:protein-disulfide isomerase
VERDMQLKSLIIIIGFSFAALGTAIADVDKESIDVAAALAPRTEGGLDAKVKLVEYFSLTCPACAKFHTKVYPKIKQKYIDTGLIQMEYRDFPLDQWGLRAAALARCVGPKYYSAMIDVLLKQQSTWTRSENILSSLLKIGQLAGLSKKRAESCMTSDKLLDGIISIRMTGNKKYDVNTTPSFLLDGQKIDAFEFEEFETLLDKAIEK